MLPLARACGCMLGLWDLVVHHFVNLWTAFVERAAYVETSMTQHGRAQPQTRGFRKHMVPQTHGFRALFLEFRHICDACSDERNPAFSPCDTCLQHCGGLWPCAQHPRHQPLPCLGAVPGVLFCFFSFFVSCVGFGELGNLGRRRGGGYSTVWLNTNLHSVIQPLLVF